MARGTLVAVLCAMVHAAANVEPGLLYCPPPTYYLWQDASSSNAPLLRCGGTTLRTLPATGTSTMTSSTTTKSMTTVTGSKVFSVTMIRECCGMRELTTTRLPFTSVNYLYDWPTTSTEGSTSSQTTPSTSSTISTTSTTTSTTTRTTTKTSTMTTRTTTSSSTTTSSTTSSSSKTTSTTTTSMTMTDLGNTTSTTSTTFTLTTSSTTSTSETTTDSTTLTTTTVTTSSTTTTLTATTTSSSTSTTTSTSSTTTTTTSSSTTSTSSTSSSTTSTPVLYPCRSRCSRFPVSGCEEPLESNGQCTATKLSSHCLDDMPVTFRCPVWNQNPERRPDVLGNFRVLCGVCGIAPSELVDLDLRRGHLLLDVQFGPNTYMGDINEEGILGYAIFLTNMDGERFSNLPLVTVPRQDSPVPTYCCRDTAYSVRVAAPFPEATDRVLLEIVPVADDLGAMPAGRLTAAVADRSLAVVNAASHCSVGAGATLAVAALVVSRWQGC